MKITANDFLKQHRDLEKKQRTLRNKVIKKMAWLLKNSEDPYLEGIYAGTLGSYTTEFLIFTIKRVEDNYTDQSTQLDMFKEE